MATKQAENVAELGTEVHDKEEQSGKRLTNTSQQVAICLPNSVLSKEEYTEITASANSGLFTETHLVSVHYHGVLQPEDPEQPECSATKVYTCQPWDV